MSTKPKVREIPVEDIEVLFTSGHERTWTLRPDDGESAAWIAGDLHLTRTGENTVLHSHAIAMVSTRKRIHKERIPDAAQSFGAQG